MNRNVNVIYDCKVREDQGTKYKECRVNSSQRLLILFLLFCTVLYCTVGYF